MKKVISLILTIAMVMTMFTLPVSAATTAGNMKVNLSTPTANGGLFGKEANEFANSLTSDASNPAKAQFVVSSSANFDFSDKKYIVLDLNVAPNANATHLSAGPNAGLFSVNSASFNANRWNSVRVVVEEKTAAEMQESGKYQPITMYINGVKVGEGSNDLAGGDTTSVGSTGYGKGFRFNVKGKASSLLAYVSDVSLSTSDVNEAPFVPVLSDGSNYTVSENVLATKDTVTPGDIKSVNADFDIKVYANDSFTVKLDDSTALSDGNIVVVKSSQGTYSYYNVAPEGTSMIFSATSDLLPPARVFKATQETATGVGGKALSDVSVKFSATEETDGNFMYQHDKAYTNTKNYFVIEANIFPIDGAVDMKSVSVHTNNSATGHAAVSGEVLGFTQNKWNKYLTYVDFTGETPKAYSYVNGKLIKEQATDPAFGVKDSNIRFCVNSGKAKEVFEVYLDDFKYYETNTLPNAVELTGLPTVKDGASYWMNDGTINAMGGVTVAQIKSAGSGIRVFTDNSFSALAEDSDELKDGMMVACENNYESLSVYPVVLSYGETEIDLRCDTFPTVANGSGETVGGFAGKDPADKVLAVTANTDTHIALKPWGTVVKTGANNDVTPSWSKSDYNGYLVVEASVFNVDNTVISLVTTQTGPVSANIAAAIPTNQWTRVKFVYNSADGDANEGKTIAYVDGKVASGWTTSAFGKLASYATNNYMSNDVRICMKGSTSGKAATYIDDIRMYETKALRDEEFIPFTAPEGCYADGYQFTYAEGISVTAGDIKALNPNVKIFASKTDYTEITDDSAVVVEGNVIFASAISQATKDAGFGYKDMFLAYTVGEMASSKDVVTSFNEKTFSVYKATVADVQGGVFENKRSVKEITDTNTSSNWYTAHGYTGLSAGMKYLVWEVDVVPTEEKAVMFFGANQHAALSGRMNVGTHLKLNSWNKVVMVYNVEANTSDLYVNGELLYGDLKGNYAEKFTGSIELRFIVESANGSKCYVDTYKIYESAIYPEIGSKPQLAEGYSNQMLVNNASYTANVCAGSSVNDIADLVDDAEVYAFEDAAFETMLGEDEPLEEGNVLVLRSEENMFTVYTVSTHTTDTILTAGDTCDGEGSMSTGTVGIYAPVAKGKVLVAVQYGEDGSLIKTVLDTTVEDNSLSIAFETEEIDKSTVKAFLFEDIRSIRPLCAPAEIYVRDYINFLILGNSYSMDVTWHLRQVAAADDVLMNVHVLNKGGCHLRYHYDNRQGNPAELGINFWENNKSLGTLYNLEQVLEKFDWDYVAIQASSTTKGLDDTSEANYQENWAVAVPFAQYIHENEPDARIVIHSTWAMESGYNFVADSNERDTIMSNMKYLNERCASEINSTLGLEGDNQVLIISSTDAVGAARNYIPDEDITINGRTCHAGTKLFDTTYYKTGHIFSSKEVNVGDGTMLLSDADRNAGKISLHRDGFHMSAVGRYLIALNAYATITGNKVSGNTFDSYDATRADGTIRLDSSPGGYHVTETDKGELSGTVYQTYDILTPEVRSVCQKIVDGIAR